MVVLFYDFMNNKTTWDEEKKYCYLILLVTNKHNGGKGVLFCFMNKNIMYVIKLHIILNVVFSEKKFGENDSRNKRYFLRKIKTLLLIVFQVCQEQVSIFWELRHSHDQTAFGAR